MGLSRGGRTFIRIKRGGDEDIKIHRVLGDIVAQPLKQKPVMSRGEGGKRGLFFQTEPQQGGLHRQVVQGGLDLMEAGYQMVEEELKRVPNEKVRRIASDNIKEIKASNRRDFRF